MKVELSSVILAFDLVTVLSEATIKKKEHNGQIKIIVNFL